MELSPAERCVGQEAQHAEDSQMQSSPILALRLLQESWKSLREL